MDNHSKRTIPHPQKKRPTKKLNKKTLIAIIAAVLAVILIIGGVIWAQTRKTDNPASADFIEDTLPTEAVQPPDTTSEPTSADTTGSSVQAMDKVMYVTASTLNVRKAPSTDSEIIAKYAKGDTVKVTGKYNTDWYKIDANGTEGYCSSKYLADNKDDSDSKDTTNDANNQYPYMITVNRTQNMVVVYAKDANGEYTVPKKAMLCSVGLNGATPTGTYKTSNRYTWRLLSGNVYGQYATRITGPILFHSVPYFTKDKSDLEYEEYNKLGEAASLGCVRLTVIDAKWIYDNCPSGTTVKIYDSDAAEPLARPTAPKIDTTSPNRGWDPTDPDKKNPW